MSTIKEIKSVSGSTIYDNRSNMSIEFTINFFNSLNGVQCIDHIIHSKVSGTKKRFFVHEERFHEKTLLRTPLRNEFKKVSISIP